MACGKAQSHNVDDIANYHERAGRWAGEFYGAHNIAIDSKSNLFITETYEGKRVQKFLYQGMQPVTVRDRAPTWPADEL